METNESLDAGGAAAPPGAETALLEPESIVEQLRALSRQIPGFGQLPGATRQSMRGAASADPAFVQAAINAVGASDAVLRAVGKTPDDLRHDSESADRWSAVEAEARALLQGIAAANLARRHRVGLAALQAYSISRELVRTDEHSDLLPHLAEMKRLNRFGRRRPRGADPRQPAPVPLPQHPQ